MASVYILYSKSTDRYYVGSCNDLSERLLQHNNHTFDDAFTRIATDWAIFWAHSELSMVQARKIELHIKKMKSRVYYQSLVSHSEISLRLIELYSN